MRAISISGLMRTIGGTVWGPMQMGLVEVYGGLVGAKGCLQRMCTLIFVGANPRPHPSPIMLPPAPNSPNGDGLGD